jgi:hypothetical protein
MLKEVLQAEENDTRYKRMKVQRNARYGSHYKIFLNNKNYF